VTLHILHERKERFSLRSVEDSEDNSDLRWTVDTDDDLKTVRAIYAGAGLADAVVPYRRLVHWVRQRPELVAGNAHVVQREG
jgi:spore coat polysaccharide biosynthesis protein SpsF